MPHVTADRVRETSTTTGTGSYALAGAAPNFRAFSAVCANADTADYAAVDINGAGWEIGRGTWSTGNTLARTTILASSNGGAAVNWSAGTRDIFITASAALLGSRAASGANSDITSLAGLTTALSVAQGGTGSTTQAGARSNLGAAAASHTHAIGDVTGLQAALDAKLNLTGGTLTGALTLNTTSALTVPVGTTAQRPIAATGQLRFNTSTSSFEGHNGTAWGSIGGGATGGGADQSFYLNSTSITASYSIPSGQNAGTFGPVSVASGAIVTVPSGSTWTIV
ncbi:hypothetical protein UFOVP345_42 [uncultured Caudovirales phage]|uniref:Uncharacterized protein n=1 Tax=uncultured Caudovirales phage TaxID=2100421 RepID=A0A6J5M1K7_9CAUD|nr:hypothetical protein UFOVP345_42 [uncultured Caudovirales phage]